MHVFAFVQICTHKLLDPPQLPHLFFPFRKDHIPLHILKLVYKIYKEKKKLYYYIFNYVMHNRHYIS